jgi:hypothetical protein
LILILQPATGYHTISSDFAESPTQSSSATV